MSATEQADSLVVVCGADGTGKTTLLNQYIASLSDDLSYAVFDDTCVDGTQFYSSFLQQIGFGEVDGTLRELQRITREFLLHRSKAGEHVLFFVDNAQLVRPAVLEQLRGVADIRFADTRVISVVLAGNLNLPRIIDSPAMSSLKFRYQTNFHIRVYTEVETDDYVRHRLRLAGAAEAAKFTDESRSLIYRFTGGIPSQINKLCNAVLTESCVQSTRVINDQLIRSVADSHQILPHVVPLKGKGRRSTDPDFSVLTMPDDETGERIQSRRPEAGRTDKNALPPKPDDRKADALRGELTDLQKALSKAEGAKHAAQLDVARRDQQIEHLQEQLAASKATADELAATIANGATELEKLKAGLSEARALLKSSSVSAEASAAEIQSLQTELLLRERAFAKLESEFKKVDEQNAGLVAEVAENQAALVQADKQVKDQASEISKLEKLLAGKNGEVAKLAADAEKNELAGQKAAKALQSEVKKLEQEQAADSKAMAKLTADIEKKEQENKDLAATLRATEKELAARAKTVDKLAADLDKWEKSKSDEVISDLREQLAAKSREVDDLLAADASVEGEISDLQETIARLREELQENEKAAKSLKADLKKEQRQSKSAASGLEKNQEELEELKRTNDELQSLIDMLNADIKSADEQAELADALKSSLEAAELERDDLQKQLDALAESQDRVGEKDQLIAELRNELVSLRNGSSTASFPKTGKMGKSKAAKSKTAGQAGKASAVVAIEVFRAGKRLQVLDAPEGSCRLMVGRAVDCDLRLNSKFVSRHHAFLFWTPDRIYMEDLNSSNGIVVNGKKTGMSDLLSSDNIIVGDFQLKLVLG
ncbi:MAG: AAA family ATPase [Woeseia sp.]